MTLLPTGVVLARQRMLQEGSGGLNPYHLSESITKQLLFDADQYFLVGAT